MQKLVSHGELAGDWVWSTGEGNQAGDVATLRKGRNLEELRCAGGRFFGCGVGEEIDKRAVLEQ